MLSTLAFATAKLSLTVPATGVIVAGLGYGPMFAIGAAACLLALTLSSSIPDGEMESHAWQDPSPHQQQKGGDDGRTKPQD